MTCWSLAITPPNREFAISRALTRCDFENVVFKIRRPSVHRGRASHRLLPAFPSYLWLSPRDAWQALREIFGIVDYIGHGQPIELAMNSLLKVSDEHAVIPTPEIVSSRFVNGDRVLINGMGVLAGQHAIFQHIIDEMQAMVLIDWMGRYVPVAVDERDLALETNDKPKPKRRKRHRRRRRHNRVDHNQRLDIPAAGS